MENKEKGFNINEIARAVGADYKWVYLNIEKLHRGGSVKIEDLGNTKRCNFSGLYNDDVYLVENERKQRLLKNKDFLVIFNRLEKINEQFILLVFGSHIKGTATKHSDIDLLLISNKNAVKRIESTLELLPYKIHVTSIDYNEFASMLKSKEFTVVSEAVKKNVILFGIEDYYRILKNAGWKKIERGAEKC